MISCLLVRHHECAINLTNELGESLLSKREFSFTLENDVYIRYKAFANAQEMKAAMTKTQPHKIDLGAVFSVSVSFFPSILWPYYR